MSLAVKRFTISLFASVIVFGCASVTMAQGPGIDPRSGYRIDQAGLGIWSAGPTPHLVIRSPQKSSKLHSHAATIPNAAAAVVWKEPYAYGYFGTKPRQHPYRSFGHQQAYTEWRWR